MDMFEKTFLRQKEVLNDLMASVQTSFKKKESKEIEKLNLLKKRKSTWVTHQSEM